MRTNLETISGHVKRVMAAEAVATSVGHMIGKEVKKGIQEGNRQTAQGLNASEQDREGQKGLRRVARASAPAANTAMIAYHLAAYKLGSATYEKWINSTIKFGKNAGKVRYEAMNDSLNRVGMRLQNQTGFSEKPFSLKTEIGPNGPKASEFTKHRKNLSKDVYKHVANGDIKTAVENLNKSLDSARKSGLIDTETLNNFKSRLGKFNPADLKQAQKGLKKIVKDFDGELKLGFQLNSKVKCTNLNGEASSVFKTGRMYKHSIKGFNRRVKMHNVNMCFQRIFLRKNKNQTPLMHKLKKDHNIAIARKWTKHIDKHGKKLSKTLKRTPKSFINIVTAPLKQTDAGKGLEAGKTMAKPIIKVAKVGLKLNNLVFNKGVFRLGSRIIAHKRTFAINRALRTKGFAPMNHKQLFRLQREFIKNRYSTSFTGMFKRAVGRNLLNSLNGDKLISGFIRGNIEATLNAGGGKKMGKKARKKFRKNFRKQLRKNIAKKVIPKPIQKGVKAVKAGIKKAFQKLLHNILAAIQKAISKLASTLVGKIVIGIYSFISSVGSAIFTAISPVLIPIIIIIACFMILSNLIPNIAELLSEYLREREANHEFAVEYDTLKECHDDFVKKIAQQMQKYDNAQVVFENGTDENYVELLSAYNVMTQSEEDYYDDDDVSYTEILPDLYNSTHFINTSASDEVTYTYTDADGTTRTGTKIFVEIQRGEYITYSAFKGHGTSIMVDGDGSGSGGVTGASGTCPKATLPPDPGWMNVVSTAKAALASARSGKASPYSQTETDYMEVNGKMYNFRPDCSGFTSICLTLYGSFDESTKWDSGTFTNAAEIPGFTKYSWSGWDSLSQGDIIALKGHVEIFDHNEDGAHYVYNCGQNSSAVVPGITRSGHAAYTTVWRPNRASTTSGSPTISTDASGTGTGTGTGTSTGTSSATTAGGIAASGATAGSTAAKGINGGTLDKNNNPAIDSLFYESTFSNMSSIKFDETTGNQEGYDTYLLSSINSEKESTSIFTSDAYDPTMTSHSLVDDDDKKNAGALDFLRYIFAQHGVQITGRNYGQILDAGGYRETGLKNLQVGDIAFYYPDSYRKTLKTQFINNTELGLYDKLKAIADKKESEGVIHEADADDSFSDLKISDIPKAQMTYIKYFKKKFLRLTDSESILSSDSFTLRYFQMNDLLDLKTHEDEFLRTLDLDDDDTDSDGDYKYSAPLGIINSAIPMIYIGDNKFVAYSWNLAKDGSPTVDMDDNFHITDVSGEGSSGKIRVYTLGSDISKKNMLGYYHVTGITKHPVYGANNMFAGWTDSAVTELRAEINQSYWTDGTVEFYDSEGNEQTKDFYPAWTEDKEHGNFMVNTADTIGGFIGGSIVNLPNIDFTTWASDEKKTAFMKEMWEAAKAEYDLYQIQPSVLIGSAGAISNYGSTEEAARYNNVFENDSSGSDAYAKGTVSVTKYSYTEKTTLDFSGTFMEDVGLSTIEAAKFFGTYAVPTQMQYYEYATKGDCAMAWAKSIQKKYGNGSDYDAKDFLEKIQSEITDKSVFTGSIGSAAAMAIAKAAITDGTIKTFDALMKGRDEKIDKCVDAYKTLVEYVEKYGNTEAGTFTMDDRNKMKVALTGGQLAVADFYAYIKDPASTGIIDLSALLVISGIDPTLPDNVKVQFLQKYLNETVAPIVKKQSETKTKDEIEAEKDVKTATTDLKTAEDKYGKYEDGTFTNSDHAKLLSAIDSAQKVSDKYTKFLKDNYLDSTDVGKALSDEIDKATRYANLQNSHKSAEKVAEEEEAKKEEEKKEPAEGGADAGADAGSVLVPTVPTIPTPPGVETTHSYPSGFSTTMKYTYAKTVSTKNKHVYAYKYDHIYKKVYIKDTTAGKSWTYTFDDMKVLKKGDYMTYHRTGASSWQDSKRKISTIENTNVNKTKWW